MHDRQLRGRQSCLFFLLLFLKSYRGAVLGVGVAADAAVPAAVGRVAAVAAQALRGVPAAHAASLDHHGAVAVASSGHFEAVHVVVVTTTTLVA